MLTPRQIFILAQPDWACSIRLLYAALGPPHDSRMSIARRWRWFLLGCLLAIALVGTVFLTRVWRGSASGVHGTDSARAGTSERKAILARHNGERPNPAVQRPGPPDSVAQKSAATSAESAARAASDLAASPPSSTD